MPKEIRYYCFDCGLWFSVKKFVSEELIRFNKKAFCTRCDKNNTNRSGKTRKETRRKGSLSDPPSLGQMNYIRYLGGDPANIRTKGEVGKYINELKEKIKEK